jgi:ABC-type transport system involved in multi-copper enzyme maturation permease subunit
VTGAIVAAFLFAVDLTFHSIIAPTFLGPYPAPDFPERSAAEMQSLMAWLFLSYIVHGLYIFYTYLRACPERGAERAVRYGLWLGVWILIPNMQFFVGLDKYTWHMLAVQVVEGVAMIALAVVVFERVYRPTSVSVAAA